MIWFSFRIDSNLLYNTYIYRPVNSPLRNLYWNLSHIERKRLLNKRKWHLNWRMLRAGGIFSSFFLSGLLKHWMVSHFWLFCLFPSQIVSVFFVFFCPPVQIVLHLWNKQGHHADVSFFKCYAAFMYPELVASCVMDVQILNRFIISNLFTILFGCMGSVWFKKRLTKGAFYLYIKSSNIVKNYYNLI